MAFNASFDKMTTKGVITITQMRFVLLASCVFVKVIIYDNNKEVPVQ